MREWGWLLAGGWGRLGAAGVQCYCVLAEELLKGTEVAVFK